ncbi:diguanylate cyclase (GGDEF)-like protein [Povalibacter uvarum]|uniref:diguanylate cyclase n=1 Tax=Povalibacter uvarum TaxID=732238 RepID=A0A841HII2_9GAMM|nr:GGDEF domain-containing protein [Povalibacter uvarum]MBB6092817.1 diguanylate cyclase (GGDEF)-like protein [Povalibacter uvarum]
MSPALPLRRSLRRFASGALSTLLAFAAMEASGACMVSTDAVMRAYDRQVGRDPAAVVSEISTRLTSGQDTDPLQRAALYGVLAEAYASLERYAETREAANKGLALVSDPLNPVYVNLLHYGASNSFDEETRPLAFSQTQAALDVQPAGSSAQACLLTALGILEHFSGRTDQASIYLTRAYRMSEGDERAPQRIIAAEVLSIVMRDLHDFSQALALNKEVIGWYEQNAPFRIAVAHFMRGAIFREIGSHAEALKELEISRELGVEANDAMGIAYADQLMCASNVDLGALAVARRQCGNALRTFTEAGSIDPRKKVLTNLAEIDLLEHTPAAALARLNQVLDQQGRDIAPFRLAKVYELRAQANTQLGHADAALADYQAYMDRYKTSTDAERAREAAALRARFETDREIERNAFLQRELQSKNEKLQAQSARLRWMIVSGLAGTAVIALLTYLLVTAKRKRALLAQLAQQDDLTALPNRRRTLQLATEAFDVTRAYRQPLTIGILDLDHFKQINDRFGHATGDFVLQEFSRIGREVIRETDVLGRWGGEEFLIVLPNTTLDVALGIVDRIREASTRIKGAAATVELKVSLSAGLATNEGDPVRLEEIIASADTALYEAKKSGRDVVRVSQESYDVASTGIRKRLRHAGIDLKTGSHRKT